MGWLKNQWIEQQMRVSVCRHCGERAIDCGGECEGARKCRGERHAEASGRRIEGSTIGTNGDTANGGTTPVEQERPTSSLPESSRNQETPGVASVEDVPPN